LPKKGDVEDALGKIAGMKKLSALPTDERAHTFEVVSEQETDLRPEIFRIVADRGWVLLELHRDAQTLEGVFRSLTIGDERRNRHLGAAAADADGSGDDEDVDDENEDQERAGAVAPEARSAAKAERS
jgi:ABC-2 type transport system ATP-binding protein